MDKFDCLVQAFASAIGLSSDKLYELLGHDGSEIIYPNEPEPFCYKMIHPQEFIDVALRLGLTVTQIDREALGTHDGENYHNFNLDENRIHNYLKKYNGVLGVRDKSTNARHAIAWVNGEVIDSAIRPKELDDYYLDTFWIIK